MINDSLVSINVLSNDVLLNKSKVPILYYWNGEGNLIESILFDEYFINNYINTIKSIEEFNSIELAFFYFNYEDNIESCENNIIYIKNYINFNQFESHHIVNELLFDKFVELYKIAFNEEYKGLEKIDESIKDVYNKIKEKYKEKISKKTIINYIISKLKEDSISNENINTIINELKQILNYE